MKTLIKRTLSIILSILFLFIHISPLYALNDIDSRVEIKLASGDSKIIINGKAILSEKPFQAGNILYVPLRVILEAFGAEVVWKGDNRINIIYRDVSIDLTVGRKKCIVNQVEKELPAAPVTVNKTTMVPAQFIKEYFDVAVSYNPASKTTSIILEDDGALSDLSFLVGSISKPQAGNSYFGWSINIPRGSRLSSSSFNSRYTLIENEHRGISLEVWVDIDSGKKLEDYFNEIKANPSAFLDSENVVDSYLNTGANPGYAEFLFNNSYNEAVFYRLFVNKGYVYKVKLTSFRESDPRKLKANTYFNGIMDSFKLGFPADSRNIQDLSRIEFGLARFENYITFESGKKFFAWELNVPPEWEVLSSNNDNPFLTKIGLDRKEYISVEVNKADGIDNIEKYGNELKKFYDVNFNPGLYQFVEKKEGLLAGYKSYKLVYNVQIANAKYTYDENYLTAGNLIYCITIKTPEEKYKKQVMSYYKILETLNIAGMDIKDLEADIEKYNYNIDKNRVGKDDNISEYKSEGYSWSIKLPGYWVKNNPSNEYSQSFSNYNTGAAIFIDAVENTAQYKGIPDEDKFRIIKSITANNSSFVGKEVLREKGGNVRLYKYRMENEEEEMYADIKFYIVDKGKYSYCYVSAIPDLCASEMNLKEMQDIWESFTPSAGKR